MARAWVLAAALAALASGGCGYDRLQGAEERVTGSWSELLALYQRRADLALKLAASAKATAPQEEELLRPVSEASKRAAAIPAAPDLPENHEAFARFQAAQAELSVALSRLAAALQSSALQPDAALRGLREELEATQKQLALARTGYIEAVEEYNVLARQLPTNLTAIAFGFRPKPNLMVEDEKEIARRRPR
jgi:LemA protein